jgi:hypothetical protein
MEVLGPFLGPPTIGDDWSGCADMWRVLRSHSIGSRRRATSDGRLAYRLKTPWRDGTTHVVMERHELLERLAPLIPPPRAH